MTEDQHYSARKVTSTENAHIYEATEVYEEMELAESDAKEAIRRLCHCPDLRSDSRTCVLYVYGSQRRQNFSFLRSLDGLAVLWDGPFIPWVLRPLTLIVSSHGGLIRIDEPRQLEEVFLPLAQSGMIEVYSFSEVRLDQVCEYVYRRKWLSFIGRIIGKDPTYFCFGIDGDNPFSESGSLAWLSYGGKCPDSLKLIASQVSAVVQG